MLVCNLGTTKKTELEPRSDFFVVPILQTNIGIKTFSVAAPIVWNVRRSSGRSFENIAQFRPHLKTYFNNRLASWCIHPYVDN